jgi:hypothetical protein
MERVRYQAWAECSLIRGTLPSDCPAAPPVLGGRPKPYSVALSCRNMHAWRWRGNCLNTDHGPLDEHYFSDPEIVS